MKTKNKYNIQQKCLHSEQQSNVHSDKKLRKNRSFFLGRRGKNSWG